MRISALTASNSTLPKDTSFDSSEAPSVAVGEPENCAQFMLFSHDFAILYINKDLF